MAKPFSELGLTAFPQYDEGVGSTEPNQRPQKLANEMPHSGARRIAGRMTRLVEGIAAKLLAARLESSHIIEGIADRGSHRQILLRTPHGGRTDGATLRSE